MDASGATTDGGLTARQMAKPATRLAFVLALLTSSLLAPATAVAARSEFFGIVQSAALDNQDLQGMLDARVRTVRLVLKWGWVQPDGQGSFKWDSADQLMGQFASRAIRPVPSVWGNPDWLPGSPSTPPIGGPASEQAWRDFLKALVARYGPGGSYWANGFRARYGPSATPRPILSWQIWNEPNLTKFFAPEPSPGKYARLLQISHDAIATKDPKARIVLAGMPGRGDIDAWDFLNSLYSVPRIKEKFDAAALHPYASTIDKLGGFVRRFRGVMSQHGDAATPLWITELAWGSAPPDSFGINKGPDGQATMLSRAYNLILSKRTAWNVERLFWYQWRDPLDPVATCSFCGSSGLLDYNRNAKPAYNRFIGFTAETTPPVASITAGPGVTNDPTPTFSFASNEPGSTFVCHVDGNAFKPCSSPRTLAPLADGIHGFVVKAIDAPGNESQIVVRYFTVDTQAPAAPRITDTDPNSPANDNAPEVKGTAEAGSTVKLFKTAGCAGTAVAQGSAAKFASPGITVSVADNTTTSFSAKARDAAGNASPCSSPFTYVEDSTTP